MRKDKSVAEAEEPLVDTTTTIPLNSKRTDRKQKKLQKKEKLLNERMTLLDLPSELLLEVLGHLKPSDIFILSRTSKSTRQFILDQESRITSEILRTRYWALSRCFQLPVLLGKVDESAHEALQSEERQELLAIHKKPYQHIKPPDPSVICTCLTCVLAWNQLCVVVDFAFWQDNLETIPKITPIPMIPRGTSPKWNQNLIRLNAKVVKKALYSSLWYARILEQHLNTTIRAIKRHGNNKGNKRKRFRMTAEDALEESDVFLDRSGPPSMDFPFHRDNYYMLEAYLPNRGWNSDKSRWMYAGSQHDRDVEYVKAWAKRRYAAAQTTQKTSTEKTLATHQCSGTLGESRAPGTEVVGPKNFDVASTSSV